MFKQNMNYINAINNLRGTMGENPQHNRHIIEQADAIEAAFNENNRQMMV